MRTAAADERADAHRDRINREKAPRANALATMAWEILGECLPVHMPANASVKLQVENIAMELGSFVERGLDITEEQAVKVLAVLENAKELR